MVRKKNKNSSHFCWFSAARPTSVVYFRSSPFLLVPAGGQKEWESHKGQLNMFPMEPLLAGPNLSLTFSYRIKPISCIQKQRAAWVNDWFTKGMLQIYNQRHNGLRLFGHSVQLKPKVSKYFFPPMHIILIGVNRSIITSKNMTCTIIESPGV